MRQRLLPAVLATMSLFAAPASHANVLQLALVLDGSGSITPGDFALQTGAYQSVFTGDFYDTFVVPSPYDSVVVAAYTFAGSNITENSGLPQQFWGEYAVFEWIPWTVIDSNAAAAGFGNVYPTGDHNR